MKTTENGPVQYQVARPRLGLYLGLGFAGAVGLALGLGGKVVWQRLAVSQVYPTQPASSVSVVDPAKQSGPNPAEKQLVAEAFTDAFGPPAGLPTGLAQQASELTGDEQGKQVVSQVRFTEAEPMAAPAGDLSFGFCQPGISSAEHLTLRGAGLTGAAGVEGTILLEPREFGQYPWQIRPIHFRTIGPDGLERVGIDFERIGCDFHVEVGQPVVQAGFILASGQTAVAGGDSRQSVVGLVACPRSGQLQQSKTLTKRAMIRECLVLRSINRWWDLSQPSLKTVISDCPRSWQVGLWKGKSILLLGPRVAYAWQRLKIWNKCSSSKMSKEWKEKRNGKPGPAFADRLEDFMA